MSYCTLEGGSCRVTTRDLGHLTDDEDVMAREVRCSQQCRWTIGGDDGQTEMMLLMLMVLLKSRDGVWEM